MANSSYLRSCGAPLGFGHLIACNHAIIESMRRVILTVDGKGSVELESGKILASLTSELVSQMLFDALETLNGEAGPGFLIIEDDAGYVQVAGNGAEFVVEWSEFRGEETDLYAAGFRGAKRVSDTQFHGFTGVIEIKSNERLTLKDAKDLCSEFVANNKRPEKYSWRKIE